MEAREQCSELGLRISNKENTCKGSIQRELQCRVLRSVTCKVPVRQTWVKTNPHHLTSYVFSHSPIIGEINLCFKMS